MSDSRLLKEKLDHLYQTYHVSYLYSDPLKYLHRYDKPQDQEIAGLIASSLAYGRVERIFSSVESVLDVMGASPADYTMNFDPAEGLKKFSGFVHRFNKGEDIVCLLYFAKQVLAKYGSIGSLFKSVFNETDNNVTSALISFTAAFLSLDAASVYGCRELPDSAGVRYFFPSPVKGSACKRLNLFLRWMARRKDGLDIGIWNFVSPSQLIIPLDTHIARLSGYLGLTRLKTPGWTMAEDITESLKKMAPDDPLKYDFALCRLGILDICPQRRDTKKCRICDIGEICML